MAKDSTKILGALRQLAVMGLPGRSIIHEVIGLLNRLTEFDIWAVRFMDEQYRLIDGFASASLSPTLIQDFVENFHNREGDGSQAMSTAGAFQSGQSVLMIDQLIDSRKLEGTPFWERIMRPTRMKLPAILPLVDAEAPFAVIVLGRAQGARNFSAAEVRLLELAYPWLCHALSRNASASDQKFDSEIASGDAGLIALDAEGKIEFASPGALMLFCHALSLTVDVSSLRHVLSGDVGTMLTRLARSVGASLHGARASCPAITARNQYGTFSVRAYALDPIARGSTSRVTVHIERQLPVAQRLFSSGPFLELSNREREVAVLLVRGLSHSEAARELGVKPSSVIHQIRGIYRRLDIESRDQLLPALLLDE